MLTHCRCSCSRPSFICASILSGLISSWQRSYPRASLSPNALMRRPSRSHHLELNRSIGQRASAHPLPKDITSAIPQGKERRFSIYSPSEREKKHFPTSKPGSKKVSLGRSAGSWKLEMKSSLHILVVGSSRKRVRAKIRITKTNFIWNIEWKKYWIRTTVNNKKWGISNQNESLMTLLLLKRTESFFPISCPTKETSMWNIQCQNSSKSF